MIRRFFSWLARRQADAHRADATIRGAWERLHRAEAIATERDPEPVNMLVDRLRGTWRRG